LRLGTCGTPKEEIPIGSIASTTASVFIARNPDAFFPDSKEEPYRVSRPVAADKELSTLV
jgi:hypothetical protein